MSARSLHHWRDTWADIRRSFVDFLAVPTATVVVFLLLALAMYTLDREPTTWIEPLRQFLRVHLISDPDKTEALLGTIAGGLITITSITFSLLLLAVQQSAASLTAQVLDQFLHRQVNQLYFGVFVGVSLYALLILATNSTLVTPVFGATVALILTLVALVVIVLLLYSTLNQMRPIRIAEAIHDLTLAARERQIPLLQRTLRAPTFAGAPASLPVHAEGNGHVTRVRLERIADHLGAARGRVEVVLLVSVGSYVTFDDVIAEIRAENRAEAEQVARSTWSAVELERQRDFRLDAAFGVDQLATIGWTSISTSKSNPAPGAAAVRNLRDLLARWSVAIHDAAEDPPLPVVYPDTLLQDAVAALESLGVVSSESLQHQSCAEVLSSFATLLPRLPIDVRLATVGSVRRLLPSLGDHVLTGVLDSALLELEAVLRRIGELSVAGEVRRARDAMARDVGTLQARGTRGRSSG
jgi:uncharacterized membrane protein